MVSNWNIQPSLYRGEEGLKNLRKLKQDVDVADSILSNMQRMGQSNTPAFMQWRSTRASRFVRYHRILQTRLMSGEKV